MAELVEEFLTGSRSGTGGAESLAESANDQAGALGFHTSLAMAAGLSVKDAAALVADHAWLTFEVDQNGFQKAIYNATNPAKKAKKARG